jgi:hypothetical protein
MGTRETADFWRNCDEYHELVEQYDRHCTVTYPNYVTTDRLVPWFFNGDSWAASAVTYYEYRGPSVSSLRNL